MNPYVLLGAVLFWAASVGSAGWFFYGVGVDSEIAGQAKISKAIEDTQKKAEQGAATAIAANKPINTTIVQKTQKEIQTERIYQDCKITPGGLTLANEALTGNSPR